jgi:hypothetical protein
MRRTTLFTVGAALAIVTVGFFLPRPAPSVGGEKEAVALAAARTNQLPVAQVVLFSSGVGYFQREGTVEGAQRIDLSFPVQDINDLLKSMVVRDLDGGHIATVSYDSNAPVEKTLKSFAVNLTGNPSFAQLLHQARGEKVEVAVQQGNAAQPANLTGAIVGVERQRQTVGKEIVEGVVLNLWCADGVRAVRLADVLRVRFLNPVLESEFRKALETLAESHDTQKKAVSIQCDGAGERRIRVGYVVENPIWKTSYRLVLAREREKKPFLQGWAVVENPSDEDWKDVRMSLVSGRPISFQMDLYTPLFVQRPTVQLELFESLRPVAYNRNLTNTDIGLDADASTNYNVDRIEKGEKDQRAFLMAKEDEILLNKSKNAQLEQYKRRFLAMEQARRGVRGSVSNDDYEAARLQIARLEAEIAFDLGQGFRSAASAAKLGDFFQYVIDKPVSLPRQKSALLPIANKDVEGTRVSIYNERTQAKFPLLGLKLKNTSGLHLMQGPITVFEGSNYAGDARIMDIQPNEERLISYAIDLGTEVNAVPSSDNGRLTALKIVNGVLHTTTKIRESKTYTIANRNDQERVVLLEHPVRNEFKLLDTDKPLETASDVYRFQVKVPAGKTQSRTVTEERIVGETLTITNFDDDRMRFFANQTVASPKLKEALAKAGELKLSLQKTQREMQEQQRQLDVITTDQARLRANLKEMPATAAAYKRYLQKFDEQETQIEKYQADIKKLQTQEFEQKKALEAFLAKLNVE